MKFGVRGDVVAAHAMHADTGRGRRIDIESRFGVRYQRNVGRADGSLRY